MLGKKISANFSRVFIHIFQYFSYFFFVFTFPRPQKNKKNTYEKEKQISKLNELLQTLNIFSFDGIWKHSDL